MTEPTPAIETATEVAGELALRVEQYIKLRDMRKAHKAAFTAADQKFALTEEKLSSRMMQLLDAAGIEMARTARGTCFKQTRTTASLRDPDAFMKFVIENKMFDLLDRKANSTAVQDYAKEHEGELPPGATLSSMTHIGVHKKASKGA